MIRLTTQGKAPAAAPQRWAARSEGSADRAAVRAEWRKRRAKGRASVLGFGSDAGVAARLGSGEGF
eukprot:364566-Chlamydomonas_euryale.AAC.5